MRLRDIESENKDDGENKEGESEGEIEFIRC